MSKNRYIVEPQNEFEDLLLNALYELHSRDPILITEQPEQEPRAGPMKKTNLATGEVTFIRT